MRRAGHDQKKATEEGATIIWVDEAGFYLLPLAVRTWAPRGQTPVLHVKLARDHLSAMSGITLDGRLFLQVRHEAYNAQRVVQFFHVLLRKVCGKIVLIWDGSPIHRAKRSKPFLKQERPNDCIWSSYPATRPILIRMKASGFISSA